MPISYKKFVMVCIAALTLLSVVAVFMACSNGMSGGVTGMTL